jgi:hypothetical protein
MLLHEPMDKSIREVVTPGQKETLPGCIDLAALAMNLQRHHPALWCHFSSIDK